MANRPCGLRYLAAGRAVPSEFPSVFMRSGRVRTYCGVRLQPEAASRGRYRVHGGAGSALKPYISSLWRLIGATFSANSRSFVGTDTDNSSKQQHSSIWQ